MEMTALDKTAYSLVVIGGLNWGLIGFFKYNLVDKIFNDGLSRFIYAVVGLAAVYCLYGIVKMKADEAKK